MRVLLVEDDEMIGHSLREALSAQGWSVDWVKDGLLAQSAWADGDYGIAIGRVGFSVASFAYTPSKAGSLLRAGRGAAAKTATGAESAVNGARLGTHLRQLEKYGQGGFRELESGRIRYYGDLSPAAKQGEMAGRRLVREWDPASGATRTWHETLDHSGNVRIVRPETGGSKTHYYFDESGGYGGAW